VTSSGIVTCALLRTGSLLATTCKDKELRLLEPRTGRLVRQGRAHQGSKAAKVGGTIFYPI
jgi:coronin-2